MLYWVKWKSTCCHRLPLSSLMEYRLCLAGNPFKLYTKSRWNHCPKETLRSTNWFFLGRFFFVKFEWLQHMRIWFQRFWKYRCLASGGQISITNSLNCKDFQGFWWDFWFEHDFSRILTGRAVRWSAGGLFYVVFCTCFCWFNECLVHPHVREGNCDHE